MTKANVSLASISRFLRKLDLWRFINLATITGRRGGTFIQSRRAPGTTMERDAWLAGARHTWASRKRARDLLALRVKRLWDSDWDLRSTVVQPKPRLGQMMLDLPNWYPWQTGSTGAKKVRREA